MPELDMPAWLEWLLVAGAAATALIAIIAAASRTARGARWIALVTQDRINAPVNVELKRIEAKVDEVVAQLTSPNNGSLREKVDTTAAEVHQLKGVLDTHIKESRDDRESLRRRLDG